jgi:DNA helicase HerA-like ATPase
VTSIEPTPVGRVLGVEDSTPLQFWVAVEPGAYLQLDDIVVTTRAVPGLGEVTASGVVTHVRARHEGAQFASDVFLIEDGVLPADVQEAAEVTSTRVDPEVYVPPRPGAMVYRAVGDQRDRALYFDRMDRKVAVGLGRDGSPVYLNFEFLDGTRGAHVSISGVSGVATKTSFALFLLYSIFRSAVLGGRGLNAKALVFSVKGEDLLFLDHANARLDGVTKDAYARLDLPAEPFASVGFYAPPTPGDTTGRPHVTARTSGVTSFWWTIEEFCQQQLLPYVFADADDERNQYMTVVHQVASRLRRDGRPAGQDGAWSVDGQLLRTYDELVDFVVEKVIDDGSRFDWAGPAIGMGTVNAFVRRLRSSLRPMRTLIRSDIAGATGRRVSTENQQVTVVDLHNLPERAQRFVVGVVLGAETERKEAAGAGSLLFVMLDELNKYAPREGTSPIKEILLDIAERGRSLGIILIGAQQTASEVERRIVANSSVRVVGRLDAAEASRPEYAFLPASQRTRATLAKPGAMFVSQPEIPVPLAVEFPFPAWATRESERGAGPSTVDSNPFGGLPVPLDDEPPF